VSAAPRQPTTLARGRPSGENPDPTAADSCPFCGGRADFALQARDRNRETTAERFSYFACRDCGTIFLGDVPADLGRYYAGDYYQFDADGQPSWKHEPGRLAAASFRVGLLREHLAAGHLIEIGAGTGAFACAAADAGFQVTAIEMSERCCRYLEQQEGVRAICTDHPEEALATAQPAQAIALWHVLEHLPRPGDLLEACAARLEPGGLLALAVPNPDSLQFRLLKARWAHLDAPRHLRLVPPDALVGRARQLGLRHVATTTNDPDGLDCNLFGWLKAFDRRPAVPSTPWLVGFAALAANRVLAPIEHRGNRGAAVTLAFLRDR
jgi:SAM-dependent methyltransferase